MAHRPPLALPRLYAILDLDLVQRRGLDPEVVHGDWLAAGVRLTQLRAKNMASGPMLALADRLRLAAHAAGAWLIVNDRVDVAVMAGADGVHVGQEDLSPASVRQACDVLGAPASFVVGFSTHDDAQVTAGLDEPVSYLAFGPVFITGTKARPDPVVGLEGLRAARTLTAPGEVPLVAIGGIGETNARDVIAAGADSVAVASDLTSKDAGQRARRLLELLAG